jgi:tRNA(Ile)-lysidine synthetase-like protein
MNIEQLYDYWFSNSNLWFNSNSDDDIRISELFGDLFNIKIDEDKIRINRKYGIGIILLYDQISRHVLRVKNEDFLYFWSKSDFIRQTNNIACKYSAIIYFNFNHEVTVDEYAFIMLPLRHTFDFIKIKYVISETWLRLKDEVDSLSKSKYKQFLKATYERAITQSNDEICINKYFKNVEKEDSEEHFNIGLIELKLKYNKILDHHYNLKDDLEEVSEIKYKQDPQIFAYYSLETEVICNLKKISSTTFILSISGGVDSMVCSYILKKANIEFSCVHINYSNRPESIDEENFVIEWCNILNVDLCVRRIDEINRPQCMDQHLRELYETYTRDVRYGTYLNVEKNPHVILGHNLDDCFENILTNISHKCKYENLLGMELLSKILHLKQTINFVRPMLQISKKSIYEFASMIGIPFLWDSTPQWSQRGKIRDQVKPVLESWDVEMVPGLFELSGTLRESLELVDILIETWILKISDDKIICEIRTLPTSKIFWKSLFQKINIRSTSRSLNGLIELITKTKNNQLKIDINAYTKYEINKEFQIKIMKMKDNFVTIFFNNRIISE